MPAEALAQVQKTRRIGRPPLNLTTEERRERRQKQQAVGRVKRAKKIKMQHDRWRHDNRELELARQRNAYREKNPPQPKKTIAERRVRRLETERLRYWNDPEHFRQKRKNRSALKRGATVSDLSAAQWLEVKEACEYTCVYCGRKFPKNTRGLTQDHLTPLARGGTDTLWNVLPACKPCNSRKRMGAVLSPVQPFLLTVAPKRRRYQLRKDLAA